VQRGESGADGCLVAALELQQKLALLQAGEPPFDIYVRWKSVAEQPLWAGSPTSTTASASTSALRPMCTGA